MKKVLEVLQYGENEIRLLTSTQASIWKRWLKCVPVFCKMKSDDCKDIPGKGIFL